MNKHKSFIIAAALGTLTLLASCKKDDSPEVKKSPYCLPEEVTDNKGWTARYSYDSAYNLISFSRRFWTNDSLPIVYTYTPVIENGLLKKLNYQYNGQPYTYMEYFYDNDEQLKETRYMSPSGEQVTKALYFYENGVLSKTEWIPDSHGKANRVSEYTIVDGNTTAIREKLYDFEGKEISNREIIYSYTSHKMPEKPKTMAIAEATAGGDVYWPQTHYAEQWTVSVGDSSRVYKNRFTFNDKGYVQKSELEGTSFSYSTTYRCKE